MPTFCPAKTPLSDPFPETTTRFARDLRRAPARALLLHLNYQLLFLKRQLIGLALGPPAAVGETFQAAVLGTMAAAWDVGPGQAVVTAPGEWVRYSAPEADGAEYVAVCLLAFSTDTVHRDEGA